MRKLEVVLAGISLLAVTLSQPVDPYGWLDAVVLVAFTADHARWDVKRNWLGLRRLRGP